MKHYETIIEGLYEAFRNASKTEYKGLNEYRFTYNNVNYMIVVTNSSSCTYIRFGIINGNFDRKKSLLVNAKPEDDIENVIKNIFEYYAKYVIADQTVIDEVIDSIIETYEET